MQNSLPYLDILIFGVIAVFLIFRLKNILGTKTGYDSSGAEKNNKSSNIIPLKPVEKNEKYNLISNDLDKIKEIDQSFNADEFLSGSRTFFKMVLESFKNAIDDRNKEEETLTIDLKSIDKNEILSHKITKTLIKINVIFESRQIIALMDKNDKLIEGDQEKEIVVKDEWVFERKIKNENPNWSLVETKSL